jgi:hypothetical protein
MKFVVSGPTSQIDRRSTTAIFDHTLVLPTSLMALPSCARGAGRAQTCRCGADDPVQRPLPLLLRLGHGAAKQPDVQQLLLAAGISRRRNIPRTLTVGEIRSHPNAASQLCTAVQEANSTHGRTLT